MSDGQRVLPQDGHVGVVGIAVDGPVGPANLVVVSHVAHQVVPPQGLCMLPKLPEPHRCRGLFAARAVLEEEAPPSVELVLEGPVSAEAGPDAQQRGQAAAVTEEASRGREHLGNLQLQRFRVVPAPASGRCRGCCASSADTAAPHMGTSNIWAPSSCAAPAVCGGPQEG
eukprot:CAMPEP_0175479950 /NCGR_PEP_ID=MMETSP0095-20121207/77705_1 /TAXON_ID=311494 /ORGANISM="Alexandrium monilatum, Strain CCMP3105" /LENGTH=169 /DNA_ID=CAMNT_0016781581 /DNA_START=27 /DNA_END=533 /DNA_ORIENTATION=-